LAALIPVVRPPLLKQLANAQVHLSRDRGEALRTLLQIYREIIKIKEMEIKRIHYYFSKCIF
jgi:hypothetical protein